MATENTIQLQNKFEYAIGKTFTLKGELDANTNPTFPTAKDNEAYYINSKGKVGGVNGRSVSVGDIIIANKDVVAGTEQEVIHSWDTFNPTNGISEVIQRTIEVKDFGTPFGSDDFVIFDHVDNTKKFKVDISIVSTGTTRTLIVPDKDGTIALIGDLTAHTSDTNNPHSVTLSQMSTGFTEGSIPFTDSAGNLIENNTNLFWDDTGLILKLAPDNSGIVAHMEIGDMLAGSAIHSIRIRGTIGDPILIGTRLNVAGTNLSLFGSTTITTEASSSSVNGITLKNGTDRNFGFWTTSSGWGTDAVRVISIGGNSVAPTSSPADVIQLWARDWNGAGTRALFMRTEEDTIHVFGSNVGFGLINPSSPLEILSTTDPQLRITHTDGVDDATFGVDASGNLTILSSGGDISFGNENLTTSGKVTLTTEGISLDVQNTTDAASNQVAIFRGGNRGASVIGDNGYFSFFLDDSTETQVEFARMLWIAGDNTAGSIDGEYRFEVMNNGTLKEILNLKENNIVLNESGEDVNTRIESLNNTSMFEVDGGVDECMIGTGTPLGAALGIIPHETTDVCLILKEITAQTADAFQILNSSGGELFVVEVNGDTIISGTLTLGTTLINEIVAAKTIEIGGEAEVGLWPAVDGFAFFGNSELDHSSAGNFAIMQKTTGATFLNSASGEPIKFRINNQDKMSLSSGGELSIGTTSTSGKVVIDQSSTIGAMPVLILDQADVSEEMIEFTSIAGVGDAIELVGAKTLTVTEFIKLTVNGNTRYFEIGTIA